MTTYKIVIGMDVCKESECMREGQFYIFESFCSNDKKRSFNPLRYELFEIKKRKKCEPEEGREGKEEDQKVTKREMNMKKNI